MKSKSPKNIVLLTQKLCKLSLIDLTVKISCLTHLTHSTHSTHLSRIYLEMILKNFKSTKPRCEVAQ